MRSGRRWPISLSHKPGPKKKYPESIQISTFILIVAIFVSLLITVLFVSKLQVMGGFTSFEQQAMDDNINHTIAGLEDREIQLDTLAEVWAGSENTLAILRSPGNTQSLSGYPDSTFVSADANVLIILDNNGQAVAHKYYSLASSGELPIPASLLEAIQNRSLYQTPDGEKGILSLSSGPMLFAARPIKDGDQIAGYLVIGRYLDANELALISDTSGSHITLEPLGTGNSGIFGRPGVPISAAPVISPESDDLIAGYYLLPDISGGSPLVLKIESPRPIFRYGLASVNYLFLSLLIVGFIFGGAILILLEYKVISRITGLNRDVQDIGSSGNSNGRVKPRGNDEIGALAESVNLMLASLDQSREKLKQSESRYANLLNIANDCIFSLSSDKNLISYNRQLKHLADSVGADLVIGGPLTLITTPDTRENFLNTLSAGLSKEPDHDQTRTFELIINGTDGSQFILETNAQYIQPAGGVSPFFFCIARDVTERKTYESSLVAVTQKLQLLSAITRHDIKNQLTILFGYLDIAGRIGHPDEFKSMCGKMERVAKRILSQIEFTGDYQELGIKNATWQDLLITFKFAISHLDMASIRQVIDIQPVEIFVDPLFEKAICNMVDNSLVHGEHVSEIRLATIESGSGLLVVYEDNGIGIPYADKEKIFRQGFGKINGFGLFLTREILSITKISIRENGEAGKGARFEIFIPKGKFRLKNTITQNADRSLMSLISSVKD